MAAYGNASASTSWLDELDRACSLPINLFILGLAIAMLVIALWILTYYCVTLHIMCPTSHRTVQISRWTRPIPRSAIYERELFHLQGLPTTQVLPGVSREWLKRRFSLITDDGRTKTNSTLRLEWSNWLLKLFQINCVLTRRSNDWSFV